MHYFDLAIFAQKASLLFKEEGNEYAWLKNEHQTTYLQYVPSTISWSVLQCWLYLINIFFM